MLLLSVLPLTSILLLCDSEFFQTAAELRPRVIASNPSPQRAQIEPQEDIFIAFDRPMDHKTTEEAFRILGTELPSSKRIWIEQRLYFAPDKQLQRGRSYQLYLDGSAKSAQGYRLEREYIVHFIVGSQLRAPEVIFVKPARNANGVAPSSPVEILFSRPMEREATEMAFRIAPDTPGEFIWQENDSAFRYHPFSPLKQAASYSLRIGSSAKDIEGIPLAETFYSSFQVGEDLQKPTVLAIRESGNPHALHYDVEGIYKESFFEIEFSEKMDFRTGNALSLSRTADGSTVAGTGQWGPLFRRLRFVPLLPLEPEQSYLLKISTTAADMAGNNLLETFYLRFTVNNRAGALHSEYIEPLTFTKSSPAPAEELTANDLQLLSGIAIDSLTGGEAQLQVDLSHSLDPASLAENILFNKEVGLHPAIGSIQGLRLENRPSSPISAKDRLIINLSGLGGNDYSLELVGGREGLRSQGSAGENGSWLQSNIKLYFHPIP